MSRKLLADSDLVRSLLGFAASLVLPSTALLQKYLGIWGAIVFSGIALCALSLFVRYGHTLTIPLMRVTDRQIFLLSALTFVVIVVAFGLLYPVVNSGVTGSGSDQDDALNVGAAELIQGRYPYYPRTYLDNPISPMPGALFLAVPFVLIGNSAYQNLFWLLVFFGVTAVYFRGVRPALLLLWVILVVSPAVLHALVIGSDYVANSLYVLVFSLWTMAWSAEPQRKPFSRILPAIMLGIGLSSRSNFLFVLPLICANLVQRFGWRTAIRVMIITCMSFLAITIPFYLYDPAGFSPLHTANKLSQFEVILPLAGFIIPAATGLLTLFLAILPNGNDSAEKALKNSAVVLAFPVMCGIILSTASFGTLNLSFARFGLFFLFFGAVANWRGITKTVSNPA